MATDDHTSEFLIDMEIVWKWLGFTTKGSAKRMLVNAGEKNVDYIIFTQKLKLPYCDETVVLKPGRHAEEIFMTIDCFKMMCMMSKTDQAKAVRKFYLTLEKRLRDGDLVLAGEVVANYDKKNGKKTNVLLQTTDADDGFDLPLWVTVWRQHREIQKQYGKNLRDIQKDVISKLDVSLSAAIENYHNQAVLGFEGTSARWKKDNGIPDRIAVADCMTKEQIDLRHMMTMRLIQLFSEEENPTPAVLKGIALKLKEFTARTSEGYNLNMYMPEVDDETGKRTYIAKKVHKLELAHKRSQKRLKTLELRQQLLEERPTYVNNNTINTHVNNMNQ